VPKQKKLDKSLKNKKAILEVTKIIRPIERAKGFSGRETRRKYRCSARTFIRDEFSDLVFLFLHVFAELFKSVPNVVFGDRQSRGV